MWQRILALVRKELAVLWRDPKSRFVVVAPPLLQLFVFSYAASFELRDIATAVVDRDRSPASRELVALLEGSPTFDPVVRYATLAEAEAALDRREVAFVLHLPPDFGRELAAGRGAGLQLLLDGRQSNTAVGILAYGLEIFDRYSRELLARRDLPQPPAQLEIRTWFNPNLESRWFIVPGLVGMLGMAVVIAVTALSIARERELGTFDQLLVAPFRPFEIAVGKMVPALLIGLAEVSLIVVAARFWFGVPVRGDLGFLYLALLLFMLAVAGIGLAISALSRTQQQAIVGTFLFMAPGSILSGFATPIQNMEPFVQTLTLANPLRYMLVVVRGVFLRDLPPSLLLDQLWPMAVIAAVTLAFASFMFRRRLY